MQNDARTTGLVAGRLTKAERDVVRLTLLADQIECGGIKALSIKQPWPHHIFHDGKDVENRDWPTRCRGWVIVHAGKSPDDRELAKRLGTPLGGVVGMMKIVDCVQSMPGSKWFCGRYGFVIGDAFPLPLIPCKGALGFFALDRDTNKAVATAMRALSPATAALKSPDHILDPVEGKGER